MSSGRDRMAEPGGLANGGRLRSQVSQDLWAGTRISFKTVGGVQDFPFLGGSTGLDWDPKIERGSVPLPTWHFPQMDPGAT